MTRAPRELATGVGFTEGPVVRSNGEIVFVSIDQGRLYRIRDGKLDVLAELGGGPNGATEGVDGTIFITQTGGHWRAVPKDGAKPMTGGIQAVARDGTVSWVTMDPVTPNDLCFGPDGFLYVTDPTRRPARDDGRLFRVDPRTGQAELLCSLPWYPNGIAFGIEDDALYVASMGVPPSRGIMRFPLDGGRLGKPELVIPMELRPDGFLFDEAGNITTSALTDPAEFSEIQTYDPSGKLIHRFAPARRKCPNVALGRDRMLIVCDAQGGAMLAIDDWPHAGLPLHPFRTRP